MAEHAPSAKRQVTLTPSFSNWMNLPSGLSSIDAPYLLEQALRSSPILADNGSISARCETPATSKTLNLIFILYGIGLENLRILMGNITAEPP